MIHLIKHYPHFFGEIIRLGKVFLNSLNCFYQLSDLTHFGLFPEIPVNFKNQQKSYFCWFFLLRPSLKITL